MRIFAAHGPMIEVDIGNNGALYYRKKDADEVIGALREEVTALNGIIMMQETTIRELESNE